MVMWVATPAVKRCDDALSLAVRDWHPPIVRQPQLTKSSRDRCCVIGEQRRRLRQLSQGQEGTDAAAGAAYPNGSAGQAPLAKPRRYALCWYEYEAFEEGIACKLVIEDAWLPGTGARTVSRSQTRQQHSLYTMPHSV